MTLMKTRVFRTRQNAADALRAMGYFVRAYECHSIAYWKHPNTKRHAEMVELPSGTTEVTWYK
jgi:hypothetical protein